MRNPFNNVKRVLAAIATTTALGLVAVVIVSTNLLSKESPILVGAGDIARCSRISNAEATAALLDNIDGTVFTLGDNAYEFGTYEEFENCYAPTWGRHKARTKPSPGDHEYLTENASGYFDYFGSAAGDPSEGYYSYDLGEWHVISLNGNCQNVGGCGNDSPMLRWLEQDLAANPKGCTLAYWHQPLFSSEREGNENKMLPTWETLYAANVDVVVNAHAHNYERFAPQTPTGAADPERGIRQFVVGTGGGALRPFETNKSNSEVRNANTHGVLELTLRPNSYSWAFIPVAGGTFTDSGDGSCH